MQAKRFGGVDITSVGVLQCLQNQLFLRVLHGTGIFCGRAPAGTEGLGNGFRQILRQDGI